MYEICNFLRRISSCSLICDTDDIRCVASEGVKKSLFFLPVFYSDTMSYGRIKNRKPGGESTNKVALSVNRSICGAANIQLLKFQIILRPRGHCLPSRN